jgi:hypothetical protein
VVVPKGDGFYRPLIARERVRGDEAMQTDATVDRR